MKNIVHLAALLSLAFILAKPVYGEGGSYEVDGLRIKGMPIRGPQTFSSIELKHGMVFQENLSMGNWLHYSNRMAKGTWNYCHVLPHYH